MADSAETGLRQRVSSAKGASLCRGREVGVEGVSAAHAAGTGTGTGLGVNFVGGRTHN